MVTLSCRDLGMKCSFVVRAKRPELVEKMLFDHALRRHGQQLKSSSGRLELIRKMERILSSH